MLDLIGVEKKRGQKIVLPDPLADGEPARVVNGAELFSPRWKEGISCDVNHRFIEATVDRVVRNQKTNPTLDAAHATPAHLRQGAETYYNTLRDVYKAQVDETAAAKAQVKQENTKVNIRRHRRCDGLRQAVPAFRERYGYDDTVGLEQLLHTDCVSSEHSQKEGRDGDDDSGDEGAVLEVQGKNWRSDPYVRILAALEMIAREIRGRKSRSAAKRRVRGPAERDYDGPPPKGNPPYSFCVSHDWAVRTGHADGRLAVLEDPDDFTIFRVEIRDEDLPARLRRGQPGNTGDDGYGGDVEN
ncbi:hypothetical protein PsYK624_167220 [Phanerochaete sordida]|uniref:Uncharacterized protein n=1 Tax=Phanerochaete sordida TaxID=48140 RepID=A0A9P3GSQ0_9APHY|nr:hypothetical protein PsYK624_167220 [Phanerochaete sordida]